VVVDFSTSEAQQELGGLVREIVADQLKEQRLRDVEAGGDRFDRTLWTTLAEAGVLAAGLPADVGGAGYGLLEQCSVLVELGRAVAPVPYLAAIVVAASTISEFGTPQQRDRWVRPTAIGDLVPTAALTEDVGNGPTIATDTTEGWRLTGAKTTVAAGMVADLFVVPAQGPDGPVVFLVTPGDSGVTLRRQEIVDGDFEAALELNDVLLDSERVLGEIGTGQRVLDWLAARATVGLCAAQLGVTERALELTARYAGERVQFERPIGTFQAVAQRLADGYIDVEAIRLTLWQAAWRLADGLPASTEVATAKFWAADGGHRVAHTAVHIHGGVGIDRDYPLHRYFVAAKRNEFSLGGATAQLRRIGSILAAEPV
jgi:3-oxocholest-4-en-26-oyl-CoA dehydrogenase beta subunit